MKGLTFAQWRHFLRIAAGPGKSNMPAAGYCGTRSEQILLDRGLIRVWEEERALGGSGTVGLMRVRWKFAEPTDNGNAYMIDHLDDDDRMAKRKAPPPSGDGAGGRGYGDRDRRERASGVSEVRERAGGL